MAETGKPYFWITDRPSDHPPRGGHVLQVTSLPTTSDAVDPKRLTDLRSHAAAFLESSSDGVVLIDCLECLILRNGTERVQRALADLHDVVTMRGGSLVVFVNTRVANPRLVAWLQRELDPLPPAHGLVTPGEGLFA